MIYFARVTVPFISTNEDGSTDRNFANLKFESSEPIRKRRIKREIRKWVKRILERNLSTYELLKLMKIVRYEQVA